MEGYGLWGIDVGRWMGKWKVKFRINANMEFEAIFINLVCEVEIW